MKHPRCARAGSTHAQTVIHQIVPRQAALTPAGTVAWRLRSSPNATPSRAEAVYGVSFPSSMAAAGSGAVGEVRVEKRESVERAQRGVWLEEDVVFIQ